MYYRYWGLKKPPFDNVPDPSMYVECHDSMENAMAETLFAIEEGDECVAVIVGDVGLGKTMSIRMIIDSLDQKKYKMVLITNPGISFVQLLQEIIGQLTGKQCNEKRKVSLLEIFNRQLFATHAEGRKILIFIDEANAISPVNLENLRLLTNMQDDRKNLFTLVLAGQNEFAGRLEHPKRKNLFQRVGTYSRIDKLDSAQKVRKYVEARLALAGAERSVFADDAFQPLWEQSDHGVPRLINKIAKLCLKAGETNRFESITGDIVEQIGSRFHKLAGPAIQKRRSRHSVQDAVLPEGDRIGIGGAGHPFSAVTPFAAGVTDEGELPSSPGDYPGMELAEGDPKSRALSDPDTMSCESLFPKGEDTAGLLSQDIEKSADERNDQAYVPASQGLTACANQEEGTETSHVTEAGESVPLSLGRAATETAQEDSEEEMDIGQVRIKINLPKELLKQSLISSQEHRMRLAGGVAAETLKKQYHLIAPYVTDPVPVWVEIRDFVLNRMSHETGECGRP